MRKDNKISPENPFWDIIQNAYKVFRVPIPQHLEVCNICCMPDALQDEMKTYSSPNIPFHLIKEWFDAATNTPVSQGLWCYILPRTLELISIGKVPGLSLEIVLHRYPTGRKENWNEEQWLLLDEFQRQFLKTEIAFDPAHFDYFTLDDKLCMFANAGWAIDDLFNQVYNLPIQILVKSLYDDWIAICSPQIWASEFWERPKEIEKKWTAKQLHDRLFEYGMAPDSPKPLADRALELVDVISTHPTD